MRLPIGDFTFFFSLQSNRTNASFLSVKKVVRCLFFFFFDGLFLFLLSQLNVFICSKVPVFE